MLKLLTVFLIFFAGSAFAMDKELECMALNIYHEARGVSEEDQMAVAHTTLNRVQSERFPDSVCAVVKQAKKRGGKLVRNKCQFSWYCDGRSDEPRDSEAWQNSIRVAKLAKKWYKIGEDFSEGATFYHANYAKPYWSKIFKRTVVLDGHAFYKQ